MIISYKEIQINNPAEAHEPGLQHNQHTDVDPHPPKKTIVAHRHPDKYIPGNKTEHSERDGQTITHKACTIPKAHFQFKWLAAFGATWRHG